MVLAILAVGGYALYQQGFLGFRPVEQKALLKVGIIQNVKHLDNVIDGFKQGLAEAGYKEGTDIVYEYQNANGDEAKIKEIARGYVTEGVDLILAITTNPVKFAFEATKEAGKPIPIVCTNCPGIVESGLVESYQSSGNNITGVVPDDIGITLKKLEFLKKINPSAKRVGVFYSSLVPSVATASVLKALREQSPLLGLSIVEYDIKTLPSPESTIAMQKIADAIKPGDIDAVITIPEATANYKENPKILISLSKRIKIPVLFLTLPLVYEGGLLSYGQDPILFGKHAAEQADKIFHGTLPKDIPFQYSKENILIINLKTAKELGLTVPSLLLSIADEVIPAE